MFGVVDEDLVHLVLRDTPRQHLWHNVVQDVGVAVAAVLGKAVLGVDVMGDHYLVLVALLDEKPQAAATRRGNSAPLASSGEEHIVFVNLQPIFNACTLFCNVSANFARSLNCLLLLLLTCTPFSNSEKNCLSVSMIEKNLKDTLCLRKKKKKTAQKQHCADIFTFKYIDVFWQNIDLININWTTSNEH